jgi:hypothetical protein
MSILRQTYRYAQKLRQYFFLKNKIFQNIVMTEKIMTVNLNVKVLGYFQTIKNPPYCNKKYFTLHLKWKIQLLNQSSAVFPHRQRVPEK